MVETNLKAFIKFNHEELFNGFDVDEYLKTRRQRDSFIETGGLSKLRGSRSDRNSLKRSYKEADSDEEFEIMDAEDDSLTGRAIPHQVMMKLLLKYVILNQNQNTINTY